MEKVKDAGAPFYRPPIAEEESEGVQPGVVSLMKQCWAEDPTERPSFDDVIKSLKVINKGKSAVLFISGFVYNCCKTVYSSDVVESTKSEFESESTGLEFESESTDFQLSPVQYECS